MNLVVPSVNWPYPSCICPVIIVRRERGEEGRKGGRKGREKREGGRKGIEGRGGRVREAQNGSLRQDRSSGLEMG